jgi:predicted alpha/beta-fold hydrolase
MTERALIASAGSRDFRPLPGLGNPHLQTILGNWWKGPPLTGRRCRVHLDDGDELVLHDNQPACWGSSDPVALLVHGLGGTHQSGYMQRTTAIFLRNGVRVVRLDLRGCGAGIGLARRSYHSGCSDDLRAAARAVHGWSPASPLLLVGFSLGGNIALKLAGEAATNPVPALTRVAVLSPPVDLVRCSMLLGQPTNRFYERYYLRALVRLVRQRQRRFPDQRQVRFPRYLTLRLFDELYTAPRWGFAGALDYYRQASSLPWLAAINVPTLVLTARDDPFIAAEPLEGLASHRHLEIHILGRGGHLGFLGWDGSGGIRWAEQFLTRWITAAVR